MRNRTLPSLLPSLHPPRTSLPSPPTTTSCLGLLSGVIRILSLFFGEDAGSGFHVLPSFKIIFVVSDFFCIFFFYVLCGLFCILSSSLSASSLNKLGETIILNKKINKIHKKYTHTMHISGNTPCAWTPSVPHETRPKDMIPFGRGSSWDACESRKEIQSHCVAIRSHNFLEGETGTRRSENWCN